MYLEVHNMLRRERCCRKHSHNMTKKDESGRYFQVWYVTPPKKHNFEMHICGFDFDVVNMEDNSFFSWGQVFNLRQGPKEQKNYGPHESWGGCMDSPPGSPTKRWTKSCLFWVLIQWGGSYCILYSACQYLSACWLHQYFKWILHQHKMDVPCSPKNNIAVCW